eukprot:484693-Pelagomonas_calceolata.AAC.1
MELYINVAWPFKKQLVPCCGLWSWLAAQVGRMRGCQVEDIGAGVVPEVGAVEKFSRSGVSQLGSA